MTESRPATSGTIDESTAWRPAAHFTARDTWLNDPNGLVYHRGTYHLFFQNNPRGSSWGNISWGHATSTDLVNWTELPVAIPCTDEEMVFSGSAVVDHLNTAGFAAGSETALVAIYTSATTAADGTGRQAQSLAYSVDDGATWTRHAGNPVLDIGSAEFRDPKVFWYGGDDDGHWVMVVVEATEHRVVVYTSPDLKSWERESTFGPAHATGGVWECPDLFPLRVAGTDETRWVMIVSLNPGSFAGGSGTQYFVGDFDGVEFTPEHLTTSDRLVDYDWLDYGRDYYAAVSFSDVPDGRRFMIGWASNWEYAGETPTAPWRSSMSLVREVELVHSPDGRHRIRQRPVLPNDASQLDLPAGAAAVAAGGDSATDDDGAASVLVFSTRVDAGDSATFVLDGGANGEPTDGEGLRITVDGDAGTVSCDRTRAGETGFHPAYASVDWAPVPPRSDAEALELRIVVDASVVELFAADDLVALTGLVFPERPYRRLSRVS